jgi:hypothetical protein
MEGLNPMKRLFLLLFASLSLHAQIPTTTNQPSGTPVIHNGVVNMQIANSVVNAAMYPGADMGEQINRAIVAVGCGEVLVPKGAYTVKTTIRKPRCVNLRGQAAYGTILNWPSTSGTAMVIADDGEDGKYPEGEVSDLTIQGSGKGSSTGTGIYIGGDPKSDPHGWGDHQNLNRVRIFGWGTGISWGNNVWSMTILESLISDNKTGLYYPAGLVNSGESINVISTSTQNNHVALDLPGFADFYFSHCRCDYNDTCGTVGSAIFIGEHFEQNSGRILAIEGTFQANVSIIGGFALIQAPAGTDADMFYVNNPSNPQFLMQGVWMNANHPVTSAIAWNGGGKNAVLTVQSLPYWQGHGNIKNLLNRKCDFLGCTIDDSTSGEFAYNSRGSSVDADGNALFKSLALRQSPSSSNTKSDSSLPITLNGKTYYIRLSSTR